jgi:ABC-type microcin C transport system permease subunit YejE
MVWDVMVAAAFVVVSVAVLACFSVKHVLTWLKKPRWRFLPFPGSMILSRHHFREIVRSYSYAGRNLDHLAARRRVGSLKWSELFRHIWSNHKEDALIISVTIITLLASSVWCIRNQEALANLLLPRSNVINQS